jgi:hypothetical protein
VRHSIPDAPFFTFASDVQSCPQAPQLSGSDWKSTHFVPHGLGAGATQLDAQLGVVEVVEQSAVGALHTRPHCPQLSGRVRSVSQPSSGRDEQCAYPPRHAVTGTEQTPA